MESYYDELKTYLDRLSDDADLQAIQLDHQDQPEPRLRLRVETADTTYIRSPMYTDKDTSFRERVQQRDHDYQQLDAYCQTVAANTDADIRLESLYGGW